MNRRGFLKAIFAAGVAPAFIGSSVLMPVRKLVMPSLDETIAIGSGNRLLTIEQITKEALRLWQKQKINIATIRTYDSRFSNS